MKLALAKGTTSYTVYLFIQNSSSTTGAGLTGLVYNSAGLVAYYVRNRGSATAITLATQTVTGGFSSGGFVEVDATNMPGVYRLDLPDAVLASGSDFAVVALKGATNMAPVALEIQLTGCDLNDAADLGLTALTGHVPQTGDAFARIGVNGAGLTAIDLPDQTMNITGNITGNLSGSVGSVTGAVGSVTGNVGGNVVGSVASVTAAVTPDAASVRSAVGLASANLDTQLSGIQSDTNDIQTRIPAALTAGGNMKSDVLAISGDTDAADKLEALMDGTFVVQVNGVATTTSIPIDGFTSTRNDQFNGRLITILDGSGEQTDIVDYVHATQTLTVTALAAAPADNVFICIH